MKNVIKMFVVAIAIILIVNVAARSDEATAKKIAKKVVEVLQEKGFTLSDAAKGVLDAGEDKYYQITMSAGNTYVVVVAGDENAKRIVLVVVDEDKQLLGKDDTKEGKSRNVAVATAQPTTTGTHYIGMRMVETSGEAASFYVVIAYK
jgi:hypothetical protein